MTKILLISSFLYMLLLAAFLAFVAIWVCDGYYPVGWGWKGALLHLAFWSLPVILIAGSFMSALGIQKWLAKILLVTGIAPFIAAVFFVKAQPQDSWFHLQFVAAIFTLAAAWVLMKASSGHTLRPSLRNNA